ncbi:MerR family transcriptional regulator [Niameybacter massiliensis]|uniref:MerR family transcriptional regulator n=1 Tax=Holtiella tumoricola TaxID=3018743 RepID=A0AA42DL55_9FIRM|nr:MerR family transcriptional regulator [Holtiella tumoricola]MDA3730994.1 MerR family transcriptional regulator [Holtiella tumoricola]
MVLDREEYFFKPRYKIGEVCKALGTTKDALRYYESSGILVPKRNEHNGYKYYSIADLEILNVTLFLRAIEVPIQEIPRFLQCKDRDSYGELLDEQIEKVTQRINYWTYIKTLLSYFQKALEDYKQDPNAVTLVKDVKFKFHKGQFDYEKGDIEKMAASKNATIGTYHISKLKIVGKNWILTNREDLSDMIIGHLCDENDTTEDVSTCTLPQALLITTLESLDKLPTIVKSIWEQYEKEYEFADKVYFVEHAFFNVFNQGELLRNIYLPIVRTKVS